MSPRSPRPRMLALELQLWIEQEYGPSLAAGTVIAALASALADVMALSLIPGRDPNETVATIAEFLQQQVAERSSNPHPMTPRELRDAYAAEQVGRPWKH